MGQPQPKTEFHQPPQEFVWMQSAWDIAKLLTDINTGKLRPKAETVHRDFIEMFGTQVLALKKGEPEKSGHGFFMHVDVERALALPDEALDEPLIFLNRGKNKGIIGLEADGSPDHLLGDGSHRVTKAFFGDTQQLKCYVLSLQQSKKYLIR